MELLWGHGEQLTPLQMGCRAFVMFFIALALIRIAGKRTFGKNSAFDIIIGFMLGAVLSRGVIGASPFFSTVAAGFVMVALHRIIARITVTQDWLGKIVKGSSEPLYKKGIIQWHEMKKAAVSEKDLMESVRMEGNVNSLDGVEEAYMERNGEISIVKKKE
ncbi:MAG TPA: YetF domain-containing protein [Chitinophagales bacterium]|nr:YetF domain-containing protein [Chitinophagales bacterium]